MIDKIMRYFREPGYRFAINAGFGIYNRMPDDVYLKRKFKYMTGYELNLEMPKTFNEKLQWLKVNDRKDIYSTMVDKYEVKSLVTNLIGDEYVIPTYGVWDKFDDIDFTSLPEKFVMKCTHNSGGLVVCRDKNKLDLVSARNRINSSLKWNYFWYGREWPYKNVKPRIICEKYMQDGKTLNLTVYKVFNFSGEPKLIQAIQDDKTQYESIDYFDLEWKKLPLKQNFPNSINQLKKPKNFDLMIKLSSVLSKGFPFLRTDFYEVNGHLFFSEFTFYSDSGFRCFIPDIWDMKLGSWIELPISEKMNIH